MTDSQAEQDTRQQYFESFADYHIPVHPTGPVEYRDTEDLTSYYLATFNRKNQLIKFIKFWRESQPAGSSPMPSGRRPSEMLYFEALREGEGLFQRGNPINFLQTENRPAYFKGTPSDKDRLIHLDLVRRTIFFVEEYIYWPSGVLKECVAQEQDGTITHTFYDHAGEETSKDAQPKSS